MLTTYLPYRSRPEDRFPGLRLLGDAELFEGLHTLYFLLKAEYGDNFYLIFDYRPALPTSAEELAALTQHVQDRTFAVLEFDDAASRDQEVEAIRHSLRGDEDYGAGVGARLRPVPPGAAMGQARRACPERQEDR